MNNIVKFNDYRIKGLEEDSKAAIVIEHQPMTLQAVKELSDFVEKLPLSNDDNDKLLELMKNQLLMSEREQYIKGFMDGITACSTGTLESLGKRLVVSDENI